MRLVTLDALPGADGQPLFLDFVNTLHWYEGVPVELIGSVEDLATWLTERGLPASDSAAGLTPAHVLREHVRTIVRALAGRRRPAAADLDALRVALAAPPGRLALVGADSAQPRLAFETTVADAELFPFQVALSLATFLESGDRRRLKLCANPGCGFAFLDTSTNASRRWCFMRYCGNRLKVRAFRKRARPRVSGRAGRAPGPSQAQRA